MRRLLWISLVVVLLLVGGGAWWLFSSLDNLVASAIRSYGPEITKVNVKLDSVKIRPTEGLAALYRLELGNPKGFATPKALEVGRISMVLDVATITQDVVRIKEIIIEKPLVTYEHASSGSNLDVIQRNVEAYVADKTGGQKQTPSSGQEKKVIIDHLYIKGASAKVTAAQLQGKVVTLPVADLHMSDIGKKAGGVTVGEASRQVITAMTQSVTKGVSSLKLDGVVGGVKSGASAVGNAVKGLFK
jgi:hypothetical protein